MTRPRITAAKSIRLAVRNIRLRVDIVSPVQRGEAPVRHRQDRVIPGLTTSPGVASVPAGGVSHHALDVGATAVDAAKSGGDQVAAANRSATAFQFTTDHQALM